MGIKFLNMQMILQLMGNHISCVHVRAPDHEDQRAAAAAVADETIKVIKWDGVVKIYEQPIHVSDVLTEYPKHLICCSDSFYIGHKIPPLSHTHRLQPGHKYFLLPQHCFQIVLSFVSIASFSRNNPPQAAQPRDSDSDEYSLHPLLKKAATCKAFDIQKSPSGCMRIRVSDEFIARLMEDSRINNEERAGDNLLDDDKERVCTTPQLRKDYRLLVGNSRGTHWKPKLETIREKKESKRRLSSFGMKKRKKKTAAVNLHLQPSSSKPSNSKAKIKIKLRK